MAKFCTNCGSQLEEGKCPKCDKKETKKVEKEEAKESSSISVEANNSIGVDLVAIFKNMIQKPFETIKAIYKTGNAKVAWLLIAISSAILGLISYVVTKKLFIGILEYYMNKMTSVAGVVGGLDDLTEMRQIINVYDSTISSMFTTIFLTGFVSVAVYIIIYALVSKLCIGNLFKGEGTVNDYLLVVAGSATLYSIYGAIAAVVSFISWKLSLLVIMFGFIVFLVASVQSFVKLLGAKKERLCYSVTITMIATVIIYGIIIGIFAGSLWSKEYNKMINTNPYGMTSSQQIIR